MHSESEFSHRKPVGRDKPRWDATIQKGDVGRSVEVAQPLPAWESDLHIRCELEIASVAICDGAVAIS